MLGKFDTRIEPQRNAFRRIAITPTSPDAERREAAPHPGPYLKREFLDELGISVAAFADAVGMDVGRLGDMLAGERSLDVDASLRIARALQISAERLTRMQTRFDFAAARRERTRDGIGVLVDPNPKPFPEHFLRGRLGRSIDTSGAASLFFEENVERTIGADRYAGLHALWRGDRLRIYADSDTPIWSGPLVHDLDGRIMLPFARAVEWNGWFASGLRADLAFGSDHAAFFARMERGDSV